jgi:hypothetical protein
MLFILIIEVSGSYTVYCCLFSSGNFKKIFCGGTRFIFLHLALRQKDYFKLIFLWLNWLSWSLCCEKRSGDSILGIGFGLFLLSGWKLIIFHLRFSLLFSCINENFQLHKWELKRAVMLRLMSGSYKKRNLL